MIHREKDRPERDRSGVGRKPARTRVAPLGGFTGLEGDFEEERRRAAAAARESIEPYEHDEVGRPTLPGSASGLTHP